jgi:hypothetical protein
MALMFDWGYWNKALIATATSSFVFYSLAWGRIRFVTQIILVRWGIRRVSRRCVRSTKFPSAKLWGSLAKGLRETEFRSVLIFTQGTQGPPTGRTLRVLLLCLRPLSQNLSEPSWRSSPTVITLLVLVWKLVRSSVLVIGLNTPISTW